jgi:uncharacterized protein
VSALALPGGQAERALRRIIDGRDVLVISRPIIDELLGVLAAKFGRDREQLARSALFLAELGEIVVPSRRFQALRDDADNRILECAVAGHADVIVTGDRQMLSLRAFRNVRIVTLRDYLES